MNEYENMTKEELLTRCLFLDEVVAERNEQIEKMKCCGNCNNFRKDFDLCFYSGGDNDYFCRLRNWELAE